MISLHAFSQQNLYDEGHTAKFAKYLAGSKQYNLALGEYKRLLTMSPENVNYQVGLMRNYRYKNWYDSVAIQLPNLYPQGICDIPYQLAHEVAISMVLNTELGYDFLRCASALPLKEKNTFLIIKSILSSEWEESSEFVNQSSDYDLRLTPLAQHEFQFIKPGLAAFLSTVIPGSGKLYARRGKDGFFSLILISSFAFQSITAFNKRGVNSVYGWVTGVMGAGYYLGNIYGSYKAAKQYNHNQEKNVQRDAREILYSME